MFGTRIVVSSPSRGAKWPCIVDGALQPGTVVEVKGSTEPVDGVYTYTPWSKADGAYGSIGVLLEDDKQGKLATDAYVTGKQGEVYFPVPGERLNVMLQDVAGTGAGDTGAIGALYGIDNGSGYLKANSSYAFPCFTLLETVAAATADRLVLVQFNG